jgi:hypothetical protein
LTAETRGRRRVSSVRDLIDVLLVREGIFEIVEASEVRWKVVSADEARAMETA